MSEADRNMDFKEVARRKSTDDRSTRRARQRTSRSKAIGCPASGSLTGQSEAANRESGLKNFESGFRDKTHAEQAATLMVPVVSVRAAVLQAAKEGREQSASQSCVTGGQTLRRYCSSGPDKNERAPDQPFVLSRPSSDDLTVGGDD